MFVSLNGSVTRGLGGADKIRLAAKVGYGGVDWDLGPAKAAGLEATKALFTELKLRPTVVGFPMARPLPFGGEDATFREALKPLAEDAAFTAAVGCRTMMLVIPASTTMTRDDQRKLAVDRLSAIDEVLRTSNVRLGLEFLGVAHVLSQAAHPAAIVGCPRHRLEPVQNLECKRQTKSETEPRMEEPRHWPPAEDRRQPVEQPWCVERKS